MVDINCEGPADRPFLGPQLPGDPAFRTRPGGQLDAGPGLIVAADADPHQRLVEIIRLHLS
jgi:hypothetical protein